MLFCEKLSYVQVNVTHKETRNSHSQADVQDFQTQIFCQIMSWDSIKPLVMLGTPSNLILKTILNTLNATESQYIPGHNVDF